MKATIYPNTLSKFVFILFLTSLFIACQSLPKELNDRKTRIEEKYESVSEKSDNIENLSDLKDCIRNFNVLLDSLKSHSEDCQKLGIDLSHAELTSDIKNKLDQLKEKRKDLVKKAVVGTWSTVMYGNTYRKEISSNGNWVSQGMMGFGSGNWEGDADEIIFYESGMATHEGYVDGDRLYLSTPSGSISLDRE
jgi:hypothetical protein